MNFHYLLWHTYADQEVYGAGAARRITNQKLIDHSFAPTPPLPLTENSFFMQVQYPGMLTGMSLFNGPEGDDEAGVDKLDGGITLDTVTGLPYLPGSTVKGILRTPFKENPEFIVALIQSLFQNVWPEPWSIDEVLELETKVFGNRNRERESIAEEVVLQGCDAFLDAFPVFAQPQKLLEAETFAVPKPDTKIGWEQLKQANILSFLKIRPGVVLEFRFLGEDIELTSGRKITIKQRRQMYIKILELMGAGAKTNSGYGNLVKTGNPLRNQAQRRAAGPTPQPKPPESATMADLLAKFGKQQYRNK